MKGTPRSASILGRVAQLLALSESPNEHEARNAALLAAQLIRKHRLVLSLPDGSHGSHERPVASEPRPRPPPRRPSARRVPKAIDLPEQIVAPLGGECIQCGRRYKADQTIYWFRAGGGLHAKCFEDWIEAHVPRT